MLVLVAIMMVGFMVALTFSVDVAHMQLSRTELRTATDAASKAAAARLVETLDANEAIMRGQEIAAANSVNGQPLLLAAEDFQFGRSAESSSGRFEFVANGFPQNSVRVSGRRTRDSPSGAIPLFFGSFLGVSLFEPIVDGTATYVERDVVLVVDRSGSMSGSKFDDLVEAIEVFADTLEETPIDERVGLASYSEFATADVSLSENLSLIVSSVAALNVGGATSISLGMEAGATVMQGSRSTEFIERTLIVMTDGQHNSGPDPNTTATVLAADGVKIHTITFGEGADISRMQEIALIGGGRHFHAENGAQLRDIYREIALTLSTMLTQ